MTGDNPYREEILTLLHRANCRYGNTFRDEEAGWSVERAARERNVKTDRIVELRASVRRACNGEHSRTRAQAGHEDGVLRALLHFRSEMSGELRQHIDTRLTRLKAEFIPDLKAVPLQCNSRGANQPRLAPSRERSCECGHTHRRRVLVTVARRESPHFATISNAPKGDAYYRAAGQLTPMAG